MSLSPLTQTELRILQALFLTTVLIGIAVRALAGGSLSAVVVGGGILGGLYFIPVALVYLVYRFGKHRSRQPT